MILVNLASSWPAVTTGEADAADITLGNWAQISDDSLDTYADSILGIYKNDVVTAFDITGWQRIAEGTDAGRVAFTGRPSLQWKHLIGAPNPGAPWTAGMARPVQYLDTTTLTSGNAGVDHADDRSMDIDGFTLTIHADGNATVGVPYDKHVTVVSKPRNSLDLELVDVNDEATFRAAFDHVDPSDWHQLRVLLDRIETHDGPLDKIGSSQKDDSGIEQWPYAVDNPVLADMRWLLRRSGLIFHVPGDWQLGDVATASAEDCVRALSHIYRSDHWCEGSFARCFEDANSVGRAVLRRAFELTT